MLIFNYFLRSCIYKAPPTRACLRSITKWVSAKTNMDRYRAKLWTIAACHVGHQLPNFKPKEEALLKEGPLMPIDELNRELDEQYPVPDGCDKIHYNDFEGQMAIGDVLPPRIWHYLALRKQVKAWESQKTDGRISSSQAKMVDEICRRNLTWVLWNYLDNHHSLFHYIYQAGNVHNPSEDAMIDQKYPILKYLMEGGMHVSSDQHHPVDPVCKHRCDFCIRSCEGWMRKIGADERSIRDLLDEPYLHQLWFMAVNRILYISMKEAHVDGAKRIEELKKNWECTKFYERQAAERERLARQAPSDDK